VICRSVSSETHHPTSRIRRCAVASLGVLALCLAVAPQPARGQGATNEWPEPLAQATGQEVSTGQAATSSADATDAQPTNILVSVRIDSPGDNGPVTQTATTAVASEAANDAATAQDASQDWTSAGREAAAQPQASAQDSRTDQAAASTASAAHARPVNTVVSVRVNSPGDDGPVTQSSTVVVGSESKNAAATAQKAHQAQVVGGSGAAARPAPAAPLGPARGAVAEPGAAPPSAPSAAPPEPTPGAVAEPAIAAPQQAAAPASAPPCVSVTRGKAIVITIDPTCHAAQPHRRAQAVKKRTPARVPFRPTPAPTPAAAPPAPVVQEVAAASPQPPARPIRPVQPAPRKVVDPLAAATKVRDFVAAAEVSSQSGTRYQLLLALLLATLGAATVWSYAAAKR
jgi:hypothetical protein